MTKEQKKQLKEKLGNIEPICQDVYYRHDDVITDEPIWDYYCEDSVHRLDNWEEEFKSFEEGLDFINVDDFEDWLLSNFGAY